MKKYLIRLAVNLFNAYGRHTRNYKIWLASLDELENLSADCDKDGCLITFNFIGNLYSIVLLDSLFIIRENAEKVYQIDIMWD